MTAPVFLFTPHTLNPSAQRVRIGDRLTLTGPEAHHAVAVRRLRLGERVDLVDGAGLRLICEVTEAGAGGVKDSLGVRLIERRMEPEPALHLALVQALAKGGRDEQAVETATEVGADIIVPWQAARSVAVWRGPKLAKGRDKWQATAREAAKQARRAVVPTVEEAMTTPALAAWIGRLTQEGGTVLILHEEATAPIGSAPLPAASGVTGKAGEAPPVGDKPGSCDDSAGGLGEQAPTSQGRQAPILAVVVGPEGGISAEETAQLEEAGAVTVCLGPHVMRTASAGPVALAVLAQRAGLWG